VQAEPRAADLERVAIFHRGTPEDRVGRGGRGD
jgi:hypothetical protein